MTIYRYLSDIVHFLNALNLLIKLFLGSYESFLNYLILNKPIVNQNSKNKFKFKLIFYL